MADSDTRALSTTSVRDFHPVHRVSFKKETDTIPPRSGEGQKKQSASVTDMEEPARKDGMIGNILQEPYEAPSKILEKEDDPWSQKHLLSLDGGGIRGLSTLLILKEIMIQIEEIEQRENPPAASSASPYMLPHEPTTLSSPRRSTSGRTSPRKSSPEPINITRNSSRTTTASSRSSSRYLPCHYFDYIAGTSTGGLIAIMLSRLKMSVDECIEEYREIGGEIFGQPRKELFIIPPALRYKFVTKNTLKVEQLFKRMINSKKNTGSVDDEEHFASSEGSCRTIVVAMRKTSSSSVPYLFRTYAHLDSGYVDPLERNPGPPQDCSIWEACRATTAAPTYFKPIRIRGQNGKFLDGAQVAQNPNWLVWNEVQQMHRSENNIDIFLSIGPRRSKSQPIRTPKGSFTDMTTPKPEYSAEQLIFSSEYKMQHTLVRRFDIDNFHGSSSRKTEQKLWRQDSSFPEIERKTKEYLKDENIWNLVVELAKKLVYSRRLRAETSKWESFVLGVRYQCHLKNNCQTPDTIYENRDELIMHLQRKHKFNSPGPDNIDDFKRILKDSQVKLDPPSRKSSGG